MNSVEDEIKKRERLWQDALDTFNKNDLAGALYLLKKLYKEGSTAALVEIGNIYELGGGGVEQDYVEARKWYERSVNEQDDPKAYLRLGKFYYAGLGVEQDFDNALFYLTQLEDEDEPGALYLMGKMYEMGQGVKQDLDTALSYYQRATALDHAIAYRDVGIVSIKQGHYLSGAITWCKACFNIFKIALHNSEDRRLRVS